MKKTRLLSMLLAVALVFTSLPLMATAVAADDAAMAKGDKVVIPNDSSDGWTDNVSFVNESYAPFTTRAGYVHPGAASNDILANFSLTEGTLYRVALNARKNANSASSSFILSIHDGASGAAWITGDPGMSTTDYASGLMSISSSEFADYYLEFTAPRTVTNTAKVRYNLRRGQNPATMDISRIAIEQYDAGAQTWTTVTEWVLNAGNVYAPNSVFSNGGVNKYVLNQGLFADVAAATSATYDIADTKLLPGVYQLTGTFNTDADSVVLSAKANDTAMVIGATTATAATIDTTAAKVTYTLTIEEEMDLTALNLNWTVDGAAAKITLSDLEFTCVDLIGASTNASIKRGTTIAENTSVAFWTTDDGEVAFNVDKWCNFPSFGKGYIQTTFDAKYTENVQATATYKAYVIAKHNGEEGTTVNMTYRHGPSGFERKFNVTTEWAEYTINTGGLWNASAGKPFGNADNHNTFFLKPTSGNADFDIRGIKIVKNGAEVVYAWGEYNGNYDAPPTTGNPTATLMDASALMLTPAAGGSTFNYNAASKNITLAPGTYTVSGSFASASGEQTVQLGANAANGTVAIGEEVTVSETYTDITVEIEIDSTTTLADISVVLGDGAAVYARDLKIAEKAPAISKPNVGILMALLLKKRATPKFEYTNLIPHVLTDAPTDYWAKPGSATLTVKETADGKQYLAFENIAKNYDTFTYTPGVTLQAGTYKISGMMRASGANSQNRIWLGDTKLGSVKIDKNWTSFDYTVTLTAETELVFKVNGDAAEVFNKPYDIINLKVINLNEDPNYVAPDPSEKEEEEKPEVKVEYIDNGNEEVVLTEAGGLAPDIFNDVGTDKWAISDQKLTVKSQGGNLYLAMRGITVNHVGFTYKSGVTLEPGTYTFSCQMRTAVKGQTTMVRAQANGTVVKLDWINNEWSTFSGEFTVNAADELVIKFFGGPDGSFIKDYDVTNIVVTKSN